QAKLQKMLSTMGFSVAFLEAPLSDDEDDEDMEEEEEEYHEADEDDMSEAEPSAAADWNRTKLKTKLSPIHARE
ncbi:unnamed protein product, partial [Symbiodinium pilosum]